MLTTNKIIHFALEQQEVFILLNNEQPIEIIIEENQIPSIGDIYYCIVREKTHNGNAYFIEYEKNKFGYLNNVKENLPTGSKHLAMVKKTGAGKVPEFSKDISFIGNFVIYKPFDNNLIAASRKLDKNTKENLKALMSDKIAGNEGVIIRSSSKNIDHINIISEFDELKQKAEKTLKQNNQPLSLVYKQNNLLEELIANNADNLQKTITTNINSFNKIKNFVTRCFPNLKNQVEFCSKPKELFDEYDIEENIENSLSSKIRIIPDGEILITQTPALTAIDIDSKNAKDNEEFLNLWIEYVALQIRLRNLSGKIIIDPPFLPKQKKLKQIISIFNSFLKNDSVNSYAAGFTPLGNIEISRERIRPTTLEILCGSDIIYNQDKITDISLNNFVNKLKAI